jgi:hypothetical protein
MTARSKDGGCLLLLLCCPKRGFGQETREHRTRHKGAMVPLPAEGGASRLGQ